MRASLPFVLGLALAAAPALAADDALKQALGRLQSRYETTRTLTADFRQSVESPTLASARVTRHARLRETEPHALGLRGARTAARRRRRRDALDLPARG